MSNAAKVLGAYIEATASGDAGRWTAFFGEGCVLETPCVPPPIPKSIVGTEKIRETFEFLFGKVFAEFEVVDLEIFGADDPEVAFARYKSRVKLRDGRDYGNDYVLFARVRDGLFVQYAEFMDTTRAMSALQTAA